MATAYVLINADLGHEAEIVKARAYLTKRIKSM